MERVVDWATRAPAGPLRGLVDGYVGYRVTGFRAGIHRGLPSRHMTFIVSIGAPIVVCAQTNPAQHPDSYRCVLSGLQASTALIAHEGSQEGVEIELSPLGCRTLFGMPAAELWDGSFESADVLGPVGDELWERLQCPLGWSGRFEMCDRILLGLMRERAVARELAAAWRGIVEGGGSLPVDRLAARTGYSRQHLTRLFHKEFGLGPKLASRVVRFERAQQALRSPRWRGSVAGVAASYGYSDQAHLTREFVDLAGCTPRELIGEDLPIVQDDGTTEA
ncbi:MAG TPA: AraC family transcriptional regulator [Aldersonia sp.]